MDVGAELRTAREAKKLSLDAVAHTTRIPHRALAAIERNDLAAIPPRPFGRGFVRAYASEMGLDGDHMAREYFAQFPPAPEPPHDTPRQRAIHPDPESVIDLSSQWAGLVTAVVLLVLVVGAAVYIGRDRGPRSEPQAVGTAGGAPTTAAKGDGKGSSGAPVANDVRPGAAVATNVAPAAPLTLAFSVDRPCWVAATVDGERTIYRVIPAGDKQTLTAAKDIEIRFGDAGAVAWTLNGRKGDSLGGPGVIRELHITPQNAATVR